MSKREDCMEKFYDRPRATGNYDRKKASTQAGLECKDPSLAIQSQRDEADINTIVKNFGITGHLPVNIRAPLQIDFEDALTFQDAQNALVEAKRSFEAMPANVRARFNNDPGAFVDFCSTEGNEDELRKLGLVDAPLAKAPDLGTSPTEKPATGR